MSTAFGPEGAVIHGGDLEVLPSAQFEVVAEGLRFPEGPVWMLDGSVVVVEVAAGAITRVWPDGRRESIQCGGGPGGAAIGPDRRLYVCNNGGLFTFQKDGQTIARGDRPPGYQGGWIDRIDLDTGEVERLYDGADGRRLSAPNDIVFDEHGGFWFTDLGKAGPDAIDKGGIFYASPDGSQISRVIDGPRANGIGLSPDGKKLYVALSLESLLIEFDVIAPGELGPAGHLPGRPIAQFAARQLLDSLAVDAAGNVAVATINVMPGVGTVDVATGGIRFREFPDPMPTNLCFGGTDMQDAWITLSSSGRLIKTRWDTPGLRLAHYA